MNVTRHRWLRRGRRWTAACAALVAAGAVTTTAGAVASPGGPVPAGGWAVARQRADALVARMTLDEKIAMVHGDTLPQNGAFAGHLPGVPRLGIPDLYLADGPNGVGNGNTGVTVFPVAESNAATWDPDLVRRYGAALGAENAGKGHNVALAPTINILRVPEWGRASETFGEDPYLTGRLAAAEVQGIQSQHVIATPKHFADNSQETYRLGGAPGGAPVDEVIPDRALHEIYEPGFESAVAAGGAGSVMCAYNQVNGSQACENGDQLTTVLKQAWDFSGYVVSDWGFAIKNTVRAANAGTDLEMPVGAHFGAALKQAVLAGAVPVSRLDDMVGRIVAAMIRIGLLDHPTGPPVPDVSTPAHRRLAAQLAEQGTVLLKNDHGALPLDRSVRSLAVIGYAADAGTHITESGSGGVTPTPGTVVTPLAGITARAGTRVRVTYAQGTLGDVPLPPVPASALHPSDGTGDGLLGTFFPSTTWTGTPVATRVGLPDLAAPPAGLPATGWSARWTGTLTPTTSGRYRFSVKGSGAFRLTVDGTRLIDMPYADLGNLTQATAVLTAGRPVSISVEYAATTATQPANLAVGWQPADPTLMAGAVRAARDADAAVVVVDDYTTEGSDRTSLALPGDEDQLIEAVAAANRRTVVVLNTGGPVLMPWLSSVDGVLAAWYPGQEYGTALAALLYGDVDPSGRLPETFPADAGQGPGRTPATFPGDGTTVRYDEGVLVGYRWYDSTGQRPLFPFGYGLSYTTFRYDDLVVTPGRDGRVTVRVHVTNTGRRAGAEVVQVYVGDPAGTGEPPKALAAFGKVRLDPGHGTVLALALDPGAFAYWDTAAQRFTVAPGRYRILVGASSRDIRLSRWLVR